MLWPTRKPHSLLPSHPLSLVLVPLLPLSAASRRSRHPPSQLRRQTSQTISTRVFSALVSICLTEYLTMMVRESFLHASDSSSRFACVVQLGSALSSVFLNPTFIFSRALPRPGAVALLSESANSPQLFVADIGFAPSLWERIGVDGFEVSTWGAEGIVRVALS